jgi:hypothetical protein
MRNITSYLNEKLKSTQQTPANNAEPQMSIQVSRARTTVMDSDYWTVETIRAKEGLGDVSVAPRRDKPYGPPNRIYEIHVDNGIVGTAIREYPDRLKEGWKNQFILGQGSSVAIAFEGDWQRHRNLWRLVTEEKPWIFWIDSNNVLWRQHWDDTLSKNQLSTDVVLVKAIRAWKNRYLADQDQGIVVGYIKKDGTVWYRSYCQQADYSYVWEPPRQISSFTGIAINLNMFITNDYRMGFVIEDSSKQIHLLVTPRNWGGMAVEHHKIRTEISPTSELIKVTYHETVEREHIVTSVNAQASHLFGRTDNRIVQMENLPVIRLDEHGVEYEDWGFLIKVELKYASINSPTITLKDKQTRSQIPVKFVEEITGSKGFEFFVHIDDTISEFGINEIFGDVQVTVSGAFNEAGYEHDIMQDYFTPINLIPPDLPLPEVIAIWNE